jgi:hypothetical protein
MRRTGRLKAELQTGSAQAQVSESFKQAHNAVIEAKND